MKTTLLLVAVFLFTANIAYSAPVADSCLQLIHWDQAPPGWNKDSLMQDRCPGSPTYLRFYGKKYFKLGFPANFYPFDHILDSNEIKSVSDIDSSHLDLLNRFLGLQDTLGLIYFQGNERNSADSIEYLNPTIRMLFANYQDVEFINEWFGNTIDSVTYFSFISYTPIPATISEDVSSQNSIQLYPNPVKNVLHIKDQSTAKAPERMEVFSLEGKRIFESNYIETLDVSFLQQGMYILKINNSSIKFAKE